MSKFEKYFIGFVCFLIVVFLALNIFENKKKNGNGGGNGGSWWDSVFGGGEEDEEDEAGGSWWDWISGLSTRVGMIGGVPIFW